MRVEQEAKEKKTEREKFQITLKGEKERAKMFIKDDKKRKYTRGERMHSMEKKQTNKNTEERMQCDRTGNINE